MEDASIMDLGTILIAVLMLAIGGAGGYVLARQQRSPTLATERELPEGSGERTQLLTERIGSLSRWQRVLAQFYAQLPHAFNVEEMATMMTSAIQQEMTDASMLIALGPVKDFMLLQSLETMHTQHLTLDGTSCIVAQPTLDAGVMRELANDLYDVVKKHRASNKRWFLLREVHPQLQTRLSQRFHINGSGIIAPILCSDVLCGVMFLAGSFIGKVSDITTDHGRFLALACDGIATWVRCMAPQILAGTAADPIAALPTQAIASLSVLEQSAEMVQESAESQEILSELVSYAAALNMQAAEIAMLARQTCHSLRQICNADVAMFLRPGSPDGPHEFAVEALDMGVWSWTSYQGYQGNDDHQMLDVASLRHWPDRFVEEVSTHGQLIHVRKSEDVMLQAKALTDIIDVASLAVIPAHMQGRCAAILVVGRKQPGGIVDMSLMVSMSVASLAGISLTALELMRQEQSLRQSLDSTWQIASLVAKQSLATLASIAQKQSVLHATRPQQVADYAEAIGMQMRLSSVEVSQIRIAALLCDLGMIMIPAHILRKEGGLTDDEQRLMQSHPAVSVALLENLDVIKGSLPIILHHHEHYDGTGYPKGLSRDRIPLGARILTVADTFVHLQIERPYRPALSRADTLATMQQEVGRQLDPNVIRALLKVLADEEKGMQAT